ncbi:MAG: energy-coupling factor transporter transmembrane protein EcfT [Atopobiaceae bacterium]|nr:energy-coupling factor transporter transmembrane protein EcfT [Atopobiaceae bacterium]
MALKLTLGQYWRADSPIHRLDPRAKLLCSLVLIIVSFIIRTPLQLAFAVIGIVALLVASKVPASKVMDSVKPIVMLMLVLSIFNLLWTQTGTQLIALGPLRITIDGVWAAIVYTARVVIAMLVGALVLLTTTPTRLTDALDALFAPFSAIGLPGHEIAMVIALTLRFVPTMAEETAQITDAQTARGGGVAEGSAAKRIRSIGPILIALFAAALRHAQNLSRALDARCYEGGASRSHFHPLAFAPRDAVACAITCVSVIILVLLG